PEGVHLSISEFGNEQDHRKEKAEPKLAHDRPPGRLVTMAVPQPHARASLLPRGTPSRSPLASSSERCAACSALRRSAPGRKRAFARSSGREAGSGDHADRQRQVALL